MVANEVSPSDHIPFPLSGVFPFKTIADKLHRFLSVPAFAILGEIAETINRTVSLLGGEQTGPLVIVQTKLYTPTEFKPLTSETGLLTAAIDAVTGPPACDQVPTPFSGVFPLNVALSKQTIWSVPAFDLVGVA